ncbi:MAG: hypothetical protein GWP41_09605 [Planctomycetia bacterium]|nr:hypothetical protein [Planctomycetia bacterium]NCG11760.1 hypothetical protein [Planctomycetia bacterium]
MNENPQHDNAPEEPWREVHAVALGQGEEGYLDPVTGLWVWTEWAHRKRGKCCESGCRHCPWREAE